MWTSPDGQAPADSLAGFFEELARRGWHVTGWSAELNSNPIYVGRSYGGAQYLPGLQDGEITVHVAPKPKPPKFARKLRRYDYRQRPKPKPKGAEAEDACPECGEVDCDCKCDGCGLVYCRCDWPGY